MQPGGIQDQDALGSMTLPIRWYASSVVTGSKRSAGRLELHLWRFRSSLPSFLAQISKGVTALASAEEPREDVSDAVREDVSMSAGAREGATQGPLEDPRDDPAVAQRRLRSRARGSR